ncbi:transferase [Novosphingopyxis baekryungensis]|uniref:transferase n=1 Tax=Novosphingopyxis baekryungensis TaxID=279369 RepID=UPI0003B6EA7E|nr:transferase [Novosphingopyxis baekryungensis]
MSAAPAIADYVSAWRDFAQGPDVSVPWEATARAEELIEQAIAGLDDDYIREGTVARHRSAVIEPGTILKGPVLLEANAFVASGVYIRGGVYLGPGCIVGPQCEVKTSFLFGGAKIAHLSFVGDSILGSGSNVEAGAIVANYRNERGGAAIRIATDEGVIETGATKFGALLGDGARVGANAVIAPGALIAPGAIVPRLTLIDQWPKETA